MGVKQMGLTLGGLVAALALPAIAATLGWRYAVGACAVVVAVPVALGWRPLAAFHADVRGATSTAGEVPSWSVRSSRANLSVTRAWMVVGPLPMAVLGPAWNQTTSPLEASGRPA